MSHKNRKHGRASARHTRGRRSPAGRVVSGALGALAGGLAGRALRPLAHQVSRRLGVPAESMIRIIEITAPVAASLAAGRMAERAGRRPRRIHRARPAGPRAAAGRDRLIPRQPPSTASRN